MALSQTFHRVGLPTLVRASPNSQAILKLDTNLNLATLPSQASLASSLEVTLLSLELTLPPANLDTQHLEQATLDIHPSIRNLCKPLTQPPCFGWWLISGFHEFPPCRKAYL